MDMTRLGRTGLMVSRSSFGALPVQRVGFDEAKLLLRKAYYNGINFFDTARGYTDSEEKIGYSLSDIRRDIVIATKSGAGDRKTLFQHLETSLSNMKTDYVDILQLHNPQNLPCADDPDSLYGGLLEAKAKGLVRFIGITSHRLDLALEAADSGLYDTVQFPLSYLSSEKDLEIIDKCREKDVGLIAMKGLSGGLLTNAAAAFAFLRQYNNVVTIWGIQREHELDQFIAFEKNPPVLDAAMLEIIETDCLELAGSFCRACGYCLPCPAEIPIPMAARMSLCLKRMPYQTFLTEEWNEKMERIESCTECGHCRENCPYELDTPSILKNMLKDYRQFKQARDGS